MIEADRTANETGIKATIRDYYESWWTANPARMEHALHPDLAKRALMPDGRSLDQDTATSMVAWTARGEGRKHADDRILELVFHDIEGSMASVKVRTSVYVEYLHLVQLPDGWKILNVLWRRT